MYSRQAYSGTTPGAVSTDFVLYTTNVTPGVASNTLAGAGIRKVVLDLTCSGPGTITPCKSNDGGTTWYLTGEPEGVSGPVHREYPVEGIQDFKLVWSNGGLAQTTWIVDVAVSDKILNPGTAITDAANNELLDTMSVILDRGFHITNAALTAVSNVFTGFVNTLPWAQFNTTPATRASGQGGPFEADSTGNLRVAEQFVTGWSYTRIVTQTTTLVKTGAGVLHAIVLNTPLANGTIEYDDALTNTTPIIGKITFPAALVNGPETIIFDVAFTTGLSITTGVANCDITIVWL